MIKNFKKELYGWCATYVATVKRHFVYRLKHTEAKAFKVFVEYKGQTFAKTFKKNAICCVKGHYHVNGIILWAKTIMPRNPGDVWVFVSKIQVKY
jgi:hypothetical protein